jgi:hypothetical protein
VLIRGLRPGSRTVGGRTFTEEAAAATAQLVGEVWRWTVAANSKSHRFPPKLHLFDQPAARRSRPAPPPRRATIEEIEAQVAALPGVVVSRG